MLTEAVRSETFWRAARGLRQADLAMRFTAAAEPLGLRVLALKGVGTVEELWGGAWNRPMADADLLVVDTGRFAEATALARSLDLIEIDASDHALVFKEPATGSVLELHIALTACPGLFAVDPSGLWQRRRAVQGSSLFRLSDEEVILHAALHTAFQHGFAANDFHYDDFTRALDAFDPTIERLEARAREWGILPALAAMTRMVARRTPRSGRVAALHDAVGTACPRRLARMIDAWAGQAPAPDLRTLLAVRACLAPSISGWLLRTAFPKPLPGLSLEPRGTLARFKNLALITLRPAPRGGRP